MSSFRATVFAFAALALSACGFHPLYGSIDGGPGIDLSSIYVKPIPERTGYVLRNELLDLFDSMGNPDGAKYRLEIELRTEKVPLGFLENAQITRYNFYLTANYALVLTTTNKAVKRGAARTITSYNVVTSPYATVTAEKDAQDRAARDVAETIRTELAVYLRQAVTNPNVEPAATSPAEPAPPLEGEPTQTQ
jgi:LPS-assembly lipoprotein